MLNEIVLSDVGAEDAERVIEEAVATYAAIHRPAKWCVGPWTRPDDFGERLSRRGFRSWEVRGMGASTTLDVGRPADVDVRAIEAPELDRFVALSMEGWAMSADQLVVERATHLAALAQIPRVAWFFAATMGEDWVGTAGVLLRDGYAYLVGAQALARARGKGVYRALVAARLAFLREHGVPYAVTHARESTSAPLLAHLGFETLFRSKCFLLDAPLERRSEG